MWLGGEMAHMMEAVASVILRGQPWIYRTGARGEFGEVCICKNLLQGKRMI